MEKFYFTNNEYYGRVVPYIKSKIIYKPIHGNNYEAFQVENDEKKSQIIIAESIFNESHKLKGVELVVIGERNTFHYEILSTLEKISKGEKI